jgi:hypothetical protein
MYNINVEMQVTFVTYSHLIEPPRQLINRLRQCPALVGRVSIKPLFRQRKQPAIDLAAELAPVRDEMSFNCIGVGDSRTTRRIFVPISID